MLIRKSYFGLLFLTFLTGFRVLAQFDRVSVEGGMVSGKEDPSGELHVYKGIPFAAPPVGPLRWKEPQPVVSWTGVRACDSFGPSPMQGKPVPFSMWSQEFLILPSPI